MGKDNIPVGSANLDLTRKTRVFCYRCKSIAFCVCRMHLLVLCYLWLPSTQLLRTTQLRPVLCERSTQEGSIRMHVAQACALTFGREFIASHKQVHSTNARRGTEESKTIASVPCPFIAREATCFASHLLLASCAVRAKHARRYHQLLRIT